MEQKPSTISVIRRVLGFAVVIFCFSALFACADDAVDTPTLADVYAANVSVVYDGRPHGISVENTAITDSVTFSLDGKEYTELSPSFTEVGAYTVYIKVVREGYAELATSATVTISPCILTGISAQDISLVHDGQEHSIVIDGTLQGDEITYSTDGITFSAQAPTFSQPGEYTVYYRVARTYGEYRSSCTVSIEPDIAGRFFNPAFGSIVLSRGTAAINGRSLPISVSGSNSGSIDGKEFSIKDGVLTYNGLSFTLMSDSEYVYKLTVVQSEIYFCAGESGSVTVAAADNSAEIAIDGQVLLSVPDVNYCESGTITDHAALRFEQTFSHSPSATEITDIVLVLSKRDKDPNDRECEVYVYDGQPHGFANAGNVLFPNHAAPPTFTEIGKHTVSAVLLSDKYLPLVTELSLLILPDLSGIYATALHAMDITDGAMYIDGQLCGRLTVAGESWACDGTAVTVCADGITYDGQTYSAVSYGVIVVYIDGEAAGTVTITEDITGIDITYDGSEITFEYKGTVLFSQAIDGDDISIVANGAALTYSGLAYVLGKGDLGRDVIILEITQ